MTEPSQFVAMQFRTQEVPEWIPLFPKPGAYTHEWWGDLDLTAERIQGFVDSFNNRIYQQHLAIDAEHFSMDPEGALGWIEELRVNADGSVDARIDWTDRGEDLIRKDRFRYVSPSYYEEWEDNHGQKHENVLAGAALTTHPWFKDGALRSIVAASDGIYLYEREPNMGLTRQLQFSERMPPLAKKLHEMTPVEIQALQRKSLSEMLVKRDFTDLSDEQAAAVTAVLDADPDTSALQEQLDAAKAEAETLKATLEQKSDPDPSVEKQMSELKSGLSAASDQIKMLSEQLKVQTERGDRLQRENDRKRFAELAKDWVGDTAKHIEHLEAMAKAFGEDDETFKFYVDSQNQAALQASELTKVAGKDIILDETSPVAKLDQLARKYSEDHKVDYHKAYAHVLTTPEGQRLYNESLN